MGDYRERAKSGLLTTFTENQDLVILRLRGENVSFTKIGEQIGRTMDAVKHRFYSLTGKKKNGAEPSIRIGNRNDKLTDHEKTRITRLRQLGLSCPDIALSIGRSTQTVSRYCRTNHIEGEGSHAARTQRAHAALRPVYEPPLKADDADHVAALNRLGGFTRENQWGSLRLQAAS